MSDKGGKGRVGTGPRSGDQYGFLEGMIRIGQERLGREVLAAVEAAVWKEVPSDDPLSKRSWEGAAPGFRFSLVDFELGSQGYPGERGADGAVVARGTVIRLGHALAARAVELARAQGGVS